MNKDQSNLIVWHLEVFNIENYTAMLLLDNSTLAAYLEIIPREQYNPTTLNTFLLSQLLQKKPDILTTEFSLPGELEAMLKNQEIRHVGCSPYFPLYKGRVESVVHVLSDYFHKFSPRTTQHIQRALKTRKTTRNINISTKIEE